jgi:hypothetical protein
MTTLREAAPMALEAWEPSDTAHRPGGLPQDFTKHEVESFDDWSGWVNPDPKQYFMKCCDCGLVHEMQFKVARYSEGDKCEFVADADLQAVFRARRTTPPQRKPVINADLEPVRLRIMGRAYDAADDGLTERHNAIKELCTVVLVVVKELMPDQEKMATHLTEERIEWVAQQIENVASACVIETAPLLVPSDCSDSHQPDAWRTEIRNDFGLPVFFCASEVKQAGPGLVPLYTTPPQRKPLTDDQVMDIVDVQRAKVAFDAARVGYRVARAIERAHGIGGAHD